MSRRLAILDKYADLCKLIEMWVVHEIQATAGSLGYPRQSAGFGQGQRIQAGYVDPTGYSAWDHRAISRSIESLANTDKNLFAAIKMYYMAWTIKELSENGYPFSPAKTYYERLQRAHVWLDSEWRIQLKALKYGE